MSVKQLLDLSGRNAIVTGGSRGLGLQIAEALGEMGARLALTARKKDELDAAVAHLAKLGIEASAWPCDIGRRETLPAVFDQMLAKLGRVDILVSNAGAVWGAPAEDHPLEAWDKLINLNLLGGFIMAQQAAKKSMIPAKWGRIIFVASVAGLTASDPAVVRTVSYNATKHAVVGMAKQLAAEASWQAGDMCLQTHGGFGFAEEYDIERKFRETRLYQIAPISTNLVLCYLAEHVLGLPRSY